QPSLLANSNYLKGSDAFASIPRIMTWLDKLERRVGFLAIPGLLRYVGFLTALVFVLEKVNPGYLRLLDLDSVAVMHGEVWRLVTYIFILQIVVGSMQFRAAAACAMANYLIFFGPAIIHDARHRRDVTTRRRRFEMQTRDAEAEALHRCAICGATEVTDPNLEFRVARNGEEYCLPHLSQAKATT